MYVCVCMLTMSLIWRVLWSWIEACIDEHWDEDEKMICCFEGGRKECI